MWRRWRRAAQPGAGDCHADVLCKFCRCAAQSSEGSSAFAVAPLVMLAPHFLICVSGGFDGLCPKIFWSAGRLAARILTAFRRLWLRQKRPFDRHLASSDSVLGASDAPTLLLLRLAGSAHHCTGFVRARVMRVHKSKTTAIYCIAILRHHWASACEQIHTGTV